jgi:hypothetical protein
MRSIISDESSNNRKKGKFVFMEMGYFYWLSANAFKGIH